MGLAEGGITYRTYYVDGDLPADYRQEFLERVRVYRFEPLTVEAEEDVRYGWVPIRNLLATAFHSADLYEYQYLLLALRIDRWALPAALLKARVRLAEEAKRIELKRDHLNRMERNEIVQRERLHLKRQTLPSVQAIDLCWNLDRGRLRFGSLSRPVNEQFVQLFEKTFSLRLVPDSPYISALHCGLDESALGRLADVEPACFIGGDHGPR